MSRRLISLLLALLAAAPCLAAQKKIAVLELHNFVGLKDQEVRYITDLVRGRALNLPQDRYFVMTRENILETLPPGTELGQCEGECEVETGRRVGADYVVSGEVIQFGSNLKVNLKMHETSSSRLVAQDAATASNIDGLELPVGEAASRMFGQLPGIGRQAVTGGKVTVTEFGRTTEPDLGKSIVNPIVDKMGFVFVESDPAGAMVIINGEEKGRTPFQQEMMVGTYVVTCGKGELYFPASEKVELTQKGLRLKMELKPNFGVLRVSSDPKGAAVEIDGEPTGKVTPYTFPPKKAGTYRVTLSKDLYLSKTIKVELGGGIETPASVDLEPNFGAIVVDSSPQGPEVFLDGNPTGKNTPIRLDYVPIGIHQVEVRSKQYNSESKRITVQRSQEESVAFELKGKFGLLVVTAAVVDEGKETPAQAAVWVNREKMSTPTPFKDKFLVGTYKIEVRTEEAKGFQATVEIQEGARTEVHATMEKMLPDEVRKQRETKRLALLKRQDEERDRLWEIEADKVRPTRSKYLWAGSVLLAAGAAATTVGIVFWSVPLQNAINDRNNARNNWANATTPEAVTHWQNVAKDNDNLARSDYIVGWVGLGVGVAALAAGIITYVFLPSLPNRSDIVVDPGRLSVLPVVGQNGSGLVLEFVW